MNPRLVPTQKKLNKPCEYSISALNGALTIALYTDSFKLSIFSAVDDLGEASWSMVAVVDAYLG